MLIRETPDDCKGNTRCSEPSFPVLPVNVAARIVPTVLTLLVGVRAVHSVSSRNVCAFAPRQHGCFSLPCLDRAQGILQNLAYAYRHYVPHSCPLGLA